MIWSLYRQKRDSRLIMQRPAWDHLAQTNDRKRGDTSERDVMPFTSLAATTAGLPLFQVCWKKGDNDRHCDTQMEGKSNGFPNSGKVPRERFVLLSYAVLHSSSFIPPFSLFNFSASVAIYLVAW